MKKLLFGLVFVTCAHASIEKIDYSTTHTFSLYKKGSSFYSELRNTRLGKGQLNITLNLRNNTENYSVKLGVNDFKKPNQALTLERSKSGQTLSLGGKKLRLKSRNTEFKLGSSSVEKILNGHWESQLSHVLKNIDRDTKLKDFSLKLVKSSLSCQQSRQYYLCELSSHVKGTKKKYASGLSELKSHLSDLSVEMKNSITNDYDIQGYRDFLTKAEGLVDGIITSVKSHDAKSSSLAKIKKMLIDERIDSYEYTAIRSQSILNFVNILMKELKS